MPVRIVLLFLFGISQLLFLTSCGYRFGSGELSSNYRTVTVPFVLGDLDGSFTSALIHQLSLSGEFEYVREGGSLVLKVNLTDFRDENIGFRYDRKKRGDLTKSVIPTETRITAFAEVSLVEACTGKVVLGPAKIMASVDFDHDYYSSRNGVNIFSLGQLGDIDAAHEAVNTPLYRALAQKLVDYVCQSW